MIKRCSSCGRPGHDVRTCGRPKQPKKKFDAWQDLEWEEHPEAQKVVADNPDGMTLEDIGDHIGVTRERVRQIEMQALIKIIDESPELYDVIVKGNTSLPLAYCEDCAAPFVRRGRQKICDTCENPTPVEPSGPNDLFKAINSDLPVQRIERKPSKCPRKLSNALLGKGRVRKSPPKRQVSA